MKGRRTPPDQLGGEGRTIEKDPAYTREGCYLKGVYNTHIFGTPKGPEINITGPFVSATCAEEKLQWSQVKDARMYIKKVPSRVYEYNTHT